MYVDRDHISRYVDIAKIVATGKLATVPDLIISLNGMPIT
jgi:hypothetical protein